MGRRRECDFRTWAAEWVAGRRSDACWEAVEWLLLRELPGYTRETLDREPAAVVHRWLLLIQAKQSHEVAELRRLHATGPRKEY